jgi:hypothetical protein
MMSRVNDELNLPLRQSGYSAQLGLTVYIIRTDIEVCSGNGRFMCFHRVGDVVRNQDA